MKKLPVIAAAMVFMASCNNSSKENSGQEVVDTSQKVTNTSKKTDETARKITDTPKKTTDDTRTGADTTTEDKTIKTGSGTTVKWTKQGSGSRSNMKDRSVLLISNKEKFDELWKIAFANNSAPQKPSVDFSKNSVVVLFLGEVTSAGHSIELLSIKPLTADEFEISVRHTKPGTGCVAATVMEHPYFLALTNEPISGKPNLKISTIETKCE